jgi:hypothetical protein
MVTSSGSSSATLRLLSERWIPAPHAPAAIHAAAPIPSRISAQPVT